jgi:type I restriction enzyme S subunit
MHLGDFIELKRGYDLPKKQRTAGSVPLVSSAGISDYHSEAKVCGPGVVTGRYGTIGEVFYVEEDFWPLNTTLYVRDFKGNDPRFTYYFLKTIDYLQYSDKAAVPGVNRNHLHTAEISVPESVTEQRRIASVLSALDDKIQLNHQINQTLEQMAQAIFKSWFVDFEPVKAKIAALDAGGSEEDALLAAMQAISGKDADQLARMQAEQPEQYAELRATAELFPSAMQDSELGEIPEGWEATTFGEVSICLDKHRVPLSKRQREQKQGNIPYYGATSVMDYVDEHIFDGIYLLVGEDGSVLKEDGTPFVQYIWGKSWVNNHAHVIQGANGVSTEQLMCFISMQNIAAYVTGAVQLKLNQKNMNSIPFVKAPNEVNEKFSQIVGPFFAKYRALLDQSSTLSTLRDSLLPKLLSGELKLPDIEEPQTECQDVAHG